MASFEEESKTNYEHFTILHIFACRMPQKKDNKCFSLSNHETKIYTDYLYLFQTSLII